MSIYPAGQCTDYAATAEPWVAKFGNLGDAHAWAAAWRNHGGAVSNTPVVGSVACFQPNVDGAHAPFGHVGVVRSVGHGTFVISEENGPAGPGHVDSRTCATVSGVQFLLPPAAPAPHPAPAPAPHPAPAPAPHPAPAPAPSGGTVWINFSGTVQVGTANVRGGATTVDPVLRQVHQGERLGFDGYCYGPAEMDPSTHAPDHRWFHLDKAHGYGWIASALVNGNPPGSHA